MENSGKWAAAFCSQNPCIDDRRTKGDDIRLSASLQFFFKFIILVLSNFEGVFLQIFFLAIG